MMEQGTYVDLGSHEEAKPAESARIGPKRMLDDDLQRLESALGGVHRLTLGGTASVANFGSMNQATNFTVREKTYCGRVLQKLL